MAPNDTETSNCISIIFFNVRTLYNVLWCSSATGHVVNETQEKLFTSPSPKPSQHALDFYGGGCEQNEKVMFTYLADIGGCSQ